jgi:hypothetical protein
MVSFVAVRSDISLDMVSFVAAANDYVFQATASGFDKSVDSVPLLPSVGFVSLFLVFQRSHCSYCDIFD